MKLIIVESPKKCDTIARYLGGDYQVMASGGHIRDLAMKGRGRLGIDVDNGFKANWEMYDRSKGVVARLSAAVKEADEVYLATDPDREGEAISWHLAQVLGLDLNSTKRLTFHEITKPAILEALKNPTKVDLNLVAAQETRRKEDRIIGFKLSSLLQKKARINSAGRVQSATLSMIVDRKRSVDSFVPEEYWTIEANVKIEGKSRKVSLTKVDGKPFKCSSKEEADAIVARIPSVLNVVSLSKKEVTLSSKPPFTTSSLQQEAFSRFHFSNSRTQAIAQRLYEGLEINGEHVGMITYLRTDSTRISPEFYARHARPFITETYGEEYIGPLRAGKGAQDAHEAIRPTGTHRTPEIADRFLSSEEAKLYRLIYNRAMASLMAPKKVERTSVVLEGNGLEFSLSGSRTLFPGFSVLYSGLDEEEADTLPEIKEGDSFKVGKIVPDQKFTKPEPLYNEASIVKAMEEQGIGRPSTYATTIQKLLDNKYIVAERGVLSPTPDGIRSTDILTQYFPGIVSTRFTAEMEATLDKVEAGEVSMLDTMNDFYDEFIETFNEASERIKKEGDVETGETCPLCGKPLVHKMNRLRQEFVACSGFPECRFVLREEKKAAEETGDLCPDCGSPLIFKTNKKGQRFVGCSNFPKCKYTANEDGTKPAPKKEEPKQEVVGVKPCPSCKKGTLILKVGKKKGTQFLGCSNFPHCRHLEWINDKKAKKDEE